MEAFDSFEPDLPVFDRLRAIVLSRVHGRNQYSQQQMLSALEACKLEYARMFREYGDGLSDDERQLYNAEVGSLDDMIQAELEREDVEPLSGSSSPPQAADDASSDVTSETDSNTDFEETAEDDAYEIHSIGPNAQSDNESLDLDDFFVDDISFALLQDLLREDEDEDKPEDKPQARYVKLSERQLTEDDAHKDDILECPISKETLKIGQTVSMLSCGHWFYPENLQSWMARSKTCPSCRAIIE